MITQCGYSRHANGKRYFLGLVIAFLVLVVIRARDKGYTERTDVRRDGLVFFAHIVSHLAVPHVNQFFS